MAVTEVHCMNLDKKNELADCGFALVYLYEPHFSDSVSGKSHCNSSFSRIYQGERPFPKQPKSLFHYLSLNSRVSFTIVMLFKSFL